MPVTSYPQVCPFGCGQTFDSFEGFAAHGRAQGEAFVVTCANGRRRYFATRREADVFAEWGHLCTNDHQIQRFDDVFPQGFAGDEFTNLPAEVTK